MASNAACHFSIFYFFKGRVFRAIPRQYIYILLLYARKKVSLVTFIFPGPELMYRSADLDPVRKPPVICGEQLPVPKGR